MSLESFQNIWKFPLIVENQLLMGSKMALAMIFNNLFSYNQDWELYFAFGFILILYLHLYMPSSLWIRFMVTFRSWMLTTWSLKKIPQKWMSLFGKPKFKAGGRIANNKSMSSPGRRLFWTTINSLVDVLKSLPGVRVSQPGSGEAWRIIRAQGTCR